MKDRFKFRIWRPTNTHIMDWKPQFIYQDILESDYCVIRQDNDVYEFCTGLNDKNGKLIYEGDIIYPNYEIKWSSLGYVLPNGNNLAFYNWSCEVIGNIHENPELLKEPITIYDLLPLLENGWVAMDENGTWFWHENKPRRGYDVDCGGVWSADKGICSEIPSCFNISPFDGNWEDSLIKIDHFHQQGKMVKEEE